MFQMGSHPSGELSGAKSEESSVIREAWAMTERDGSIELMSRMTELEEKFSFQEDTLQQLNDVVALQGRQITELAAQLKSCKEQLDGLRERDRSGGIETVDERPPHY
jgi:SlyX protein